MPQASEEMAAKWGGYEGIGPEKAEAYLQARDFILTKWWSWLLPYSGYEMTRDESEAMRFLIDEWDYEGLDETNF